MRVIILVIEPMNLIDFIVIVCISRNEGYIV